MKLFYRPQELADELGIAKSTLYHKLQNDPNAPPRVKIGKGTAVAFRGKDVEKWLEVSNEEPVS